MTEKKYRIEYDRERCIGAAVCVAFSPKTWDMNNDGKADLLESKEESPGIWVKEIDEADFEENRQAAEGCPVNVIHIIDKATGKKLI